MERGQLEAEQKTLDNTIHLIENKINTVRKATNKRRRKFKTKNSLPGDDVAYKRGMIDKEDLKRALKAPYFGKLNLYTNKDGDHHFYIGRQGVMDDDDNTIIVDWRRPLAQVYYNFVPGQPFQIYEVDDKEEKITYHNSVQVRKKLDLNIKNHRILQIAQQVAEIESDENITITESGEITTVRDEFLKTIIENSETTGYLKEIITTIQSEQDIAIRQPINKNVIIQGIAGSGKSFIALHRLSYLLFNNKHLRPESFLILGPSELFLNSVTDLLPELDLEGIQQVTVQQVMIDELESVLSKQVVNPYKAYFEELLFKNSHHKEREIIEFKGSQVFALIADIYMDDLKTSYIKKIRPITLFGQIMERDTLLSAYKSYKDIPLGETNRLFLEYVIKHFRNVKNRMINGIKDQHRKITDFFERRTEISRQEKQTALSIVQKSMTSEMEAIEQEFKEAKQQWTDQFQVEDALSLYKRILTYDILRVFENETGPTIPQLFKDYTLKLTYFDLAPILYIHLLIYDPLKRHVHIVIDEAQDLSYVHFAAFKKLTNTMTILGDKNQSIFMKYGQYDWNELLNTVFDSDKDSILKLETSYRTTQKIIKVANKVFKAQYEGDHKPFTALNREGKEVNISKVKNGEHLLKNIYSTLDNWRGKYKRIAIIHKDERRAKKLTDHLKTTYDQRIEYIETDGEVTNTETSVLASYNSKGMEFDAVILINVDNDNYPQDTIHARLLYVLLTRAQQEVKAFYLNIPSPLIEKAVKTTASQGSMYDDIL